MTTHSLVRHSIVFIHPPVLFNHAYPPYLSDHFIQIYLRSWSELNEGLRRPRESCTTSHLSSIFLIDRIRASSLHSTSIQSSAGNIIWSHTQILY